MVWEVEWEASQVVSLICLVGEWEVVVEAWPSIQMKFSKCSLVSKWEMMVGLRVSWVLEHREVVEARDSKQVECQVDLHLEGCQDFQLLEDKVEVDKAQHSILDEILIAYILTY